MDFGKLLRAARMKKGLTQQELADRIGIALQSYQRYEQGNREPSLKTLSTLADLLDVSADYLLGREKT